MSTLLMVTFLLFASEALMVKHPAFNRENWDRYLAGVQSLSVKGVNASVDVLEY